MTSVVARQRADTVEAELPTLPFADSSFDLALCSHFLFLYSLQFDEASHLESIILLCRIAHEARIFPLVTLAGERSPYVDRRVAGSSNVRLRRDHPGRTVRVPTRRQSDDADSNGPLTDGEFCLELFMAG